VGGEDKPQDQIEVTAGAGGNLYSDITVITYQGAV
jgi:hypothetical protein